MALDQETFTLLKESVRRFVQERLVPNEDRVEHEDEVPAEIIAEMKELGLFGLSIPEEYGGIGLSMREEVEIGFELGQTALAFRSVFGTNVGIGSQGILMDGTEEQRRSYLPKIASGEYVFSFALTEPGAGSDAASLATSAVLDGDHYIINGTKRFITNAVRPPGLHPDGAHRRRQQGRRRHFRLHRAARHPRHHTGQDRQKDGPARHQNVRRDF